MATLYHTSSSLSSHHRSKESTGLSAARDCQLSLSLSSSLLFLSCSSLSQLARIIRSVSTSVTPPILSMSTSSSTAPPSALGECVVCGKESSTRCSSCAKGGVEWMFFCSREHQKLVSSLILSMNEIDLADLVQ